ncbi:uncharacterized protein N7443_007220 [Penicillium atrosanguineum]|uniref:MARVEL domain-containing protein n=1 Tax=Penicillium atrosanguineum TaxID=1132637 RepID=A0A9W9PL65_9EURO|nr:uncharacterized protein N7443_007220 [Penicillium atrosanguineum]KAJ5118291.1 hypothetical protein N7526_009928 [Penicillium atrosanguineum]KAJ5296327.1 hypothetical protein N7443_007220 [Penicillium atrosanguineum]KAJ5299096.1 hypothetical protein N7476_010653 [Penicillium atrosanguineum]
MAYSTAISRPLQLATRTLQWISAVIVMGLTSYFISVGPTGQHLIYQEVIAVLSVVFFLPAFVSPFLPTALSKFVLAIDVIFSYLWLTAFIFAAQDYNWHLCYFHSPAGIPCGRKYANEAFMFLAFFFTFCGVFLEVAALWAYRKGNRSVAPIHEKNGAPGTRAPLDAPAETTAPAGTV